MIKQYNEYSCTDVYEKNYLMQNGFQYSFVKVVDGITTWKFKETKELFQALKQYIGD